MLRAHKTTTPENDVLGPKRRLQTERIQLHWKQRRVRPTTAQKVPNRCASTTFQQTLQLKRSFLSEKCNDLESLKTRKPIRPLTNQEKQQLERAALIFLKHRFKGPAHIINPKTGLQLEQVARKTRTLARKKKSRDIREI